MQISNEDRHFTTQILAAGFSVVHVPDAVVETDTPNSFTKWIRQQVRWMRGTMIETTAYPLMLYRMFPWVIYNLVKTRFLPLVTFWVVTQIAVTGQAPEWLGLGSHLLQDCVVNVALQIGYLLIYKPNGVGARRADLLWVLPSLLWVFLWFPPIVVWSSTTVFDGLWGTTMRATIKGQPQGNVAQNNVFSRRRKWAVPSDMALMFLWALLVMKASMSLMVIALAMWLGVAVSAICE